MCINYVREKVDKKEIPTAFKEFMVKLRNERKSLGEIASTYAIFAAPV